MRVLITGVSGAAGAHLARYALTKGAHVSGIDLRAVHFRDIVEYEGNLTQPEAAESLISKLCPHRIFHLAALVPSAVSHFSSEMLIKVNVLGTLNVLEAVKKYTPDARTLVVSSASVYGPVSIENQPITETMPLNPVTVYGSSKAMQDLLASQYATGQGLDIVRARTFNQIGPGTQTHLFIGTLVRQVAEIEAGMRGPEIFLRYLSTRRDFLDVRDIVRAYWDLLEYGRSGAAYNVCSGKAYSLGDIVHELLAMTNLKNIRVVSSEDELARDDVPLSVGDRTRLTTETGWKQEISLQQSLHDMLDEWRQRLKEEKG